MILSESLTGASPQVSASLFITISAGLEEGFLVTDMDCSSLCVRPLMDIIYRTTPRVVLSPHFVDMETKLIV